VVREIGDLLRQKKRALAKLISLEMGKILPESKLILVA
jgi:acyl-CoA reductase-like NAD-dependent aldehyde dehydrogenase